ncbi:chromate efflux transporter [Roseovarius aestuariivivens]|uniref:chromate efflux transporter n=1 Tax=Roseovarius aestuariivivens TaxID=1888910 RepID=UPI00108073B3|nr:chromate efflux transporter [Roseovarius aestuariivivens]
MTPSVTDLFRVFGRIGLLSFGGPAAQISLMQTELVDRHGWLSEKQFLQALSFCMLLPGPEAMQLATYSGWRLRGVQGGLLAGLLFVLPGAAIILALAFGYAFYGQVPVVQALFSGVKAAVVIIVFQALTKLSRRALQDWQARALAILAFAAIFFFSVPFPAIIAMAALIGALGTSKEPHNQQILKKTSPLSTLRTVLLWGAIWALPICLLWAVEAPLLLDVALFFSKLAVVTFGGAYAVLAYMTQEIVQGYGWLSTDQMIDALGLAETTPGPLILVTEFTAFLAGYYAQGPALGILAALICLWVTFTPCFLWIFAAAPYLETLLSRPRLQGAFNAISASVAGVILNLAVWFTLHVLFRQVTETAFGPLISAEDFSIFDAGLVLAAAIVFLGLRLSMPVGLAAMAALSGLAHLLV